VATCRGALLAVGGFSVLTNILMLAGPLFMLQVYDRVLVSRSLSTLAGLLALLVGAYAFQGLFDIIRGRIMVRTAETVDRLLSGPVQKALLTAGRSEPGNAQALRDLDQLRSFVGSSGPLALFDLPFLPLFLVLCWLIHPLIGLVALVGGGVLLAVAVLSELGGRRSAAALVEEGTRRADLADAMRRNGDLIDAMGMGEAFHGRFASLNDRFLAAVRGAADLTGGLGAISKILRLLLQSIVLAAGAFLVVEGQLTGGAMVASSILVARAVSPIETLIANWRGLLAARLAYRRLSDTLAHLEQQPGVQTRLGAPRHSLEVADAAVVAPHGRQVIVDRVGFRLEAGTALGVIGPSGSGKSSLGRVLAGIWHPARGRVLLDGADFDQYDSDVLGSSVGYMAQATELFAGTVAENIARMAVSPDSESVIAAARAAGAHEMIVALPSGYDTRIGGADGYALSGGQQQRVALARALFGAPFLLVLDEPNSNLDSVGEAALVMAIEATKERGGAVVLITHRPSLTLVCDNLLYLAEGAQRVFGRRDDVLRRLEGGPARPATGNGLKVVEPHYTGVKA
jgi:PrtD family type I secretion system ABC transporter